MYAASASGVISWTKSFSCTSRIHSSGASFQSTLLQSGEEVGDDEFGWVFGVESGFERGAVGLFEESEFMYELVEYRGKNFV